jgi:hypothetical protein
MLGLILFVLLSKMIIFIIEIVDLIMVKSIVHIGIYKTKLSSSLCHLKMVSIYLHVSSLIGKSKIVFGRKDGPRA